MAAHKEYGKTHPEHAREYYRRNRKKMLEYGRKYREKTNPEYAREYYQRNKEKMLEYGRKYREARKANSTARH